MATTYGPINGLPVPDDIHVGDLEIEILLNAVKTRAQEVGYPLLPKSPIYEIVERAREKRIEDLSELFYELISRESIEEADRRRAAEKAAAMEALRAKIEASDKSLDAYFESI